MRAAGFLICVLLVAGDGRACLMRVSGPAEASAAIEGRIPCAPADRLDLIVLPHERQPMAAEGARDLTFTFTSNDEPWTAAELTRVRQIVADAYPSIKEVFGEPFASGVVNIRKNSNTPYSGYYDARTDEIGIHPPPEGQDVPADVVVHEIIHAFRDEAIMSVSSYEEGMTRAAELAVFDRLPQYPHWDRSHRYDYDVYYDGLNRRGVGCPDGGVLCGQALTLTRYQTASYAWTKAALEDRSFFRDFNAAHFLSYAADPSVSDHIDRLEALVASVISTVEGVPVTTWLHHQHVLNGEPRGGCLLFQRISQLTFDLSCLNGPIETYTPGAAIDWAVSDAAGSPLASGSLSTAALGWATVDGSAVPNDYRGRITVTGTAESASGRLTSTAVRPWPGGQRGLFGVALRATAGFVDAEVLDPPAPMVTVPLTNGVFEVPELESYAGRVRVTLRDSSGRSFSRIVTKDAAPYFVEIDDVPPRRRAVSR